MRKLDELTIITWISASVDILADMNKRLKESHFKCPTCYNKKERVDEKIKAIEKELKDFVGEKNIDMEHLNIKDQGTGISSGSSDVFEQLKQLTETPEAIVNLEIANNFNKRVKEMKIYEQTLNRFLPPMSEDYPDS